MIALDVSNISTTREEFATFIDTNGTRSIMLLFPHLVSAEKVKIRNRGGDESSMGHKYLCRGTYKFFGDEWVPTSPKECAIPLNGPDSFMRHLKSVHLGIKRRGKGKESLCLAKWATSK